MKRLEIGELRHRITFQKHSITVNDYGFEEEAWEDFKTVWAAISNLHGREYYAAAQVQAEHTVKFAIRYLPGLDTAMRILFRGRQYNITSINNIRYQNRFMEIKALDVTADG